MVKTDRIEQWIKEIEERPSSAPLILQYIANRLRELSVRNDELVAEIIALQSGNRVEEYEKRIEHLEYQLELIKRQIGEASVNVQQSDKDSWTPPAKEETTSLLVYDSSGKVLRLELEPEDLAHERCLGQIRGDLLTNPEPPRMLAVHGKEEMLVLFTSGRIAVLPVKDIPAFRREDANRDREGTFTVNWQTATVPSSPHAGERLTCLAPVSRLSLVDWFIQVSRKGFLKKIRIGMADSIFQNHYIGSGVRNPPDLSFDLLLSKNEDRLTLVSWEGVLICHEVKKLPVSLEPVIRLSSSDHLAAVLLVGVGQSLMVMTNVGKIVHFTEDRLQVADSIKAKSLPVYSARRQAEGVRVVGAACGTAEDWACMLDLVGRLSVHQIGELAGSGTVASEGAPIAFCSLPTLTAGR